MEDPLKFLLLISVFLTTGLFAQTTETNDRKVFECKLKVFPKIKKLGIKFLAYNLNDEQDILTLPRYYSVQVNNQMFSISGAITKDDECNGQKACRMVVYLKADNESPAVGYANDATKVGAMNETAKLSCVARKFISGETDVLSYED